MHNRAIGFYFEQDYLAAEETARRTIRAYPEHPSISRLYLWLAAALGQLGRTAEARTTMDAAIAASPSYFKYKTDSRAPYMRPRDHEHLLDGLRKAGWRG